MEPVTPPPKERTSINQGSPDQSIQPSPSSSKDSQTTLVQSNPTFISPASTSTPTQIQIKREQSPILPPLSPLPPRRRPPRLFLNVPPATFPFEREDTPLSQIIHTPSPSANYIDLRSRSPSPEYIDITSPAPIHARPHPRAAFPASPSPIRARPRPRLRTRTRAPTLIRDPSPPLPASSCSQWIEDQAKRLEADDGNFDFEDLSGDHDNLQNDGDRIERIPVNPHVDLESAIPFGDHDVIQNIESDRIEKSSKIPPKKKEYKAMVQGDLDRVSIPPPITKGGFDMDQDHQNQSHEELDRSGSPCPKQYHNRLPLSPRINQLNHRSPSPIINQMDRTQRVMSLEMELMNGLTEMVTIGKVNVFSTGDVIGKGNGFERIEKTSIGAKGNSWVWMGMGVVVVGISAVLLRIALFYY